MAKDWRDLEEDALVHEDEMKKAMNKNENKEVAGLPFFYSKQMPREQENQVLLHSLLGLLLSSSPAPFSSSSSASIFLQYFLVTLQCLCLWLWSFIFLTLDEILCFIVSLSLFFFSLSFSSEDETRNCRWRGMRNNWRGREEEEKGRTLSECISIKCK